MPQPSRPEPDAIVRTLASLKWIALVTAFTLGGAWVDAKTQIAHLRDGKLDAAEYRLDRARRDARDSALAAAIRRVELSTVVTERRVSEIYCANKRDGCR